MIQVIQVRRFMASDASINNGYHHKPPKTRIHDSPPLIGTSRYPRTTQNHRIQLTTSITNPNLDNVAHFSLMHAVREANVAATARVIGLLLLLIDCSGIRCRSAYTVSAVHNVLREHHPNLRPQY